MFICFIAFVVANMKKGETLYFRLKSIHFLLPIITLFLTTSLIWVGEKHVLLRSLGDQFSSDQHSSSVLLKNVPSESEDGHAKEAQNIMSISPLSAQIHSTDVSQSSNPAEGCNYGKGRWVEDKRRPLYSGFSCKRWLSAVWACRLMRRQDFSYERFRWQPLDCDLPEFNNIAFLTRMQNKTIAFVGDSLGRQQFQSLMCMATGGNDTVEVEDAGKEYGLTKRPGAIRPDGYAYRFIKTNTTIIYYWSSSLAGLNRLNKTDPETKIAMHLDKPPAFLSRNIHRFDVLVLNTGHHWNNGKFKKNKWKMYVNDKPNEDQNLSRITNAKTFTIRQITNWVDSQMTIYPNLKAFFRTLSPRHFVNGEWNTGGNCDSTIPLMRGSEVLQDRSIDEVVSSAVNGTKVKILDITGLSKLRDEGHISRYGGTAKKGTSDCLHWCLPGIPDTWNELLVAQILIHLPVTN